MTLPVERSYAVLNMGAIVHDMIEPIYSKRTKRTIYCKIPVSIVAQLVNQLKNYPHEWHIDDAARKVPEIFGRIK